MADTRLTKINVWYATYLILLALFAPKKFIEKQEEDNKKRKNFSQPPPQEEPKIILVRKAFWKSFLLVIVSAMVGYSLGFVARRFCVCIEKGVATVLQIIGAMVLLWATLFVRGWEIQSLGGVTLAERVNRWIFRFLYFVGTAIIVSSFAI